MKVDNLRELSLTSTSKGMLYKCIADIEGKKVYIKTGTKFRNKLSILEPVRVNWKHKVKESNVRRVVLYSR